jgi:hypothetical protein
MTTYNLNRWTISVQLTNCGTNRIVQTTTELSENIILYKYNLKEHSLLELCLLYSRIEILLYFLLQAAAI